MVMVAGEDAHRRERHRESRLGQAVAGEECRALETRIGKPIEETIDGFGLNALGAAAEHAHGGEISLKSDLERGTRAILRLPTAPVPAGNAGTETPSS